MSLRHEVLIRRALLQRQTLIETKKLHIEMLKIGLLDCAINEKCCSVDGGWGISSLLLSFFIPTLGDFTVPESPAPRICHSRQKKC